MDIKKKIFREKLTDKNRFDFEFLKELLQEEDGKLFLEIEVKDPKKGEIGITGHGICLNMSDRRYAEMYPLHGENAPAMLTEVNFMDEYAYLSVLIAYPWLTFRELMENPSPEDVQQVPELKAATPEPQRVELRVVGLKHHADEADIQKLIELKMNQTPVTLVSEPENGKDPMAVRVLMPDGKLVGYVRSEESPFVSLLAQERGKLEAEIGYVNEYQWQMDCTLRIESDRSAELVNLFSRHTPQAIYKAYFANRMWIHTWDDDIDSLFFTYSMRIDFDRLLEKSVSSQNYIASTLHGLMFKAEVYNPTNHGLLMSVPLDLSDYGTTWDDVDLKHDYGLLSKIGEDNKMLAIFLRYRRTVNRRATVKDFTEDYGIDIDSHVLRKRMQREAEKMY